jgi:putative transposase
MIKLNQKKIDWIIKQKEQRVSSSEIARIQKITTRYVNMIYEKYKKYGKIIVNDPGRKKDKISEDQKDLVLDIRSKYPTAGALAIEHYLKDRSINMTHNKIHRILKEEGMAMDEYNKKKQRKWVRYERKHSNSLWHMDWFEYEEKNYCKWRLKICQLWRSNIFHIYLYTFPHSSHPLFWIK